MGVIATINTFSTVDFEMEEELNSFIFKKNAIKIIAYQILNRENFFLIFLFIIIIIRII
jgi:hypothetical protein